MASSTLCISCAVTAALLLHGCGSKTDGGATFSKTSIGDRLVLEIEYSKEYKTLPLTTSDAQKEGWVVDTTCDHMLGHLATSEKHENLHLWFDTGGAVVGFGASMNGKTHDAASPWYKKGDEYWLSFLIRDPALVCNQTAPEAGSVGDRLVMIGSQHMDMQMTGGDISMPLSLDAAFADNYTDGGPCFPDMGWHMMYGRKDVTTPVPVYSGNGAGGKLLAMNLNTFYEQDKTIETGAFEYPAPKEGKACYGFHVYFRDHEGACDKSPSAALIPFKKTPEDKERDYTCTPYFPHLWVQTLTTVVDTKSTEEGCADIDGPCQFVHYAGPTNSAGYGTACKVPAPTDGCHKYYQVTYTSECEEALTTRSNLTARIDASLEFDSKGVLKVCSDMVASEEAVCWGPPSTSPVSCECGDSPNSMTI